MRKTAFLFIVAFILLSCERVIEIEGIEPNDQEENLLLTRASVFDTVIIDHSITIDQAQKIVSNVFPEKSIKSVTTVKDCDEDLLYVTSFDSGWALVAADDRLQSPILAYDDSGVFNPENIVNPGVKVWYEMQKERLLQLRRYHDSKLVPVHTNIQTRNYEPYYWLGFLVDEDYSCTTGSVSPLLDTKWGQGTPWNAKAPLLYPYGRYPAGCLAVATGQILRYLQVHKGFSIGLYHTVAPTFAQSGTSFSISNMAYGDYNEPSSRWAAMSKICNDGLNSSYVADLLIDIGYRYGLVYTPYSTGALFLGPVFDTFNVISYTGAYYFSLVKGSLDDGYPVMVTAYQHSDFTNGHAWVIDGYHLNEQTVDKSYRWYIASSDSLSYYSGYDFCYTEAEKQLYAPDANEEEIYHIVETTGGNYLRMNWGWDGAYDSGYYAMIDYHWPVGNDIQYTYYPFITYGYYQEEEPEYN